MSRPLTMAYAGSVIRNYRDFFKQKHNRDCKLSDEEVLDIINTIFDDSSTDAEDEARVEVMLEREQDK